PPAPSATLEGQDLAAMSGRSLRRLAREAGEDEDYKAAIQYQHYAVAKNGSGHYDLACFYALDGNTDGAFYWLQRAGLEEGVDPAWAAKDTDLAEIRLDPRWPEIASYLRRCAAY